MVKKITVLITPIDGVGHYNACLGIAEHLRDRGHKVIFAVQDPWRNKLKPKGFIEEWYNPEIDNDQTGGNPAEAWSEMIAYMAPAFVMSPEEQITHLMLDMFKESVKEVKDFDPKLKRIVEKVKPDVILADLLMQQPAVMDSGYKWVMLFSMNPACISSKNIPPAFSGYPTGEQYRELWDSYLKEYKAVLQGTFDEFQNWLTENGGPNDLEFNQLFTKYSPYANIYMCPEELDYTKFRLNPPNFHRFDTFIRNATETFDIPESLLSKPGKLIYFSMGTIGCSELNMMKRLIAILSKSPHRFIVSKGARGDELELSDNMWGANSVPQTKVLPLVDFVITHGGNNTVTESFYFGKPLIILPLFGDQLDNAQRVQEAGLGIRLNSHKVTEEELLAAIDKIASDQRLADQMKSISTRIQSSNSQSRAADLIEQIAIGSAKN